MDDGGTPVTGPLHIDCIALPSGGRIGMTNCPGRTGVDGSGRSWMRDLAEDLAMIDQWGTSALVTLIERSEFTKLGIPELAQSVRDHSFSWFHVPIADMQAPDQATRREWDIAGPRIVAKLRSGESVVFHCAAGLGRTGTMVAKLLVDAFGFAPAAAIDLVRSRRPGTIESLAQEQFVAGPPMLPPVERR